MRVSARVRANRLNAKRSTGPKSTEGKARSAKNSFKHGLSIPVGDLPDFSGDIQAVLEQLIDNNASDDAKVAATEIAEAQVDINRVRHARASLYENPEAREKKLTSHELDKNLRLMHRMVNKTWVIDDKTGDLLINHNLLSMYLPLMAQINLKPIPQSLEEGIGQLQPSLAKLWRYERRALSRRRKAITQLNKLTLG
jgi:hypothetical protein